MRTIYVLFDSLNRLALENYGGTRITPMGCFDPYEPVFPPERLHALYPTDDDGPILNGPRYQKVQENAAGVAEILASSAALVRIGDDCFGKLMSSFAFLCGFPVLKLPAGKAPVKGQGARIGDARTVLYDLQTDPGQMLPIDYPEVESRLIGEMTGIMTCNEAPPEAYRRLGLDVPQN